jgi:lipid A 3-O-deacylase
MKRFVIILGILLTSTLARAQDHELSGVQVYEENDTFAFHNASDKFYTQGLRLTATLNPSKNPDWISGLSSLLCKYCSWKPDPIVQVGLGQSIYTPSRIDVARPQPFDRPWAGWLYATASLHQTEANTFTPTVQQIVQIDLGIVGPGAGASRAQSVVHQILNAQKPLGWHNQIRNQAGLDLFYQRNRRYGTQTADVVWHYDASLGNVMTYAGAGTLVRLGHNITGFPVNQLQSTVQGVGTPPRIEGYVFAGVDGRAVAENIFIRGGDSRIEQKPFVYDRRVGFSLRYDRVRFTYNYVRRSREFTSPVTFPANHDFGSFSLSVGS